jgi:isoleucyl-tRNA synthetase
LDEVPGVAVVAALAEGVKCERCWKVLPEVGTDADHPTLCRRCVEAVEAHDADHQNRAEGLS